MYVTNEWYTPIYVPIHLSVCLSIYLSTYLSLFLYISIYAHIYIYTCMSLNPSASGYGLRVDMATGAQLS